MNISARNQLQGTVASIRPDMVNAEVVIDLPGGIQLTAVASPAGIQTLGLAPGKQVVALIKASSVLLLPQGSGQLLSARNCLNGTVKQVTSGAVNAEVVVQLPGGSEIVAVVDVADPGLPALVPGAAATAVIKASAILLGIGS